MQNLYLLAHAGVEHADEAEAAQHSDNTTLILLVTAAVLVVAAIAIKLLSKKSTQGQEPKPTKEK